VLAEGRMVCHALVVETNEGLVLVDTGFGIEDVRAPAKRLGRGIVALTRPRLREEDVALRQIERLGFGRADVRHVVVTHLDLDHAGGIPDFPDARIHVHRAELAAALAPATQNEKHRYRKVHLQGNPRWELHEAGGDRWFGFESARAVGDDVILIPLHGHTRGHCAVAVRAPSGSSAEWLLHCGDAYFFHQEIEEPPVCPVGLRIFQRAMAVDDAARVANARRLRALHREAGGRVRLFSAHSPQDYEALSAR
jgi:glyoxylase-like metal-dependent hydrolase (beta-lactamase superfamily II)